MRLLLIDDDDVDRMMVERLLRGGGESIEIVHANTAHRGLQLFNESSFDAVLLDLMLPDMDGMEVLCALQLNPSKRTAIIILTGGNDGALELEYIQAGAQDFLMKHDISAAHLRRALMHSRARNQLESKLIESREAVRDLTENDPLTGISNRHFFDKSLRVAMATSQRGEKRLALLLLDIDNFKLINDSMGHDAGDALLRSIASRLIEVASQGDIVCRIGGDEFAIIATTTGTDLGIISLVQHVQCALRSPFQINHSNITISSSVGIAIAPDNGNTADEMLKFAEMAMYTAKRNGKDCFHFFAQGLQVEAQRKATIERELRSAHLIKQLELFYQPLLDARTWKICGAEALLRWNHPTRGLISAGEFIDVAEEFGLMSLIDTWVRQTVFRQMAQWLEQEAVSSEFRLTFNVSAATLKDKDLAANVVFDLQQHRLPAGRIEMEVTESTLVEDFQRSAVLLNQIKDHGIDIAVDDFGTGYSSMAYLKHLPAATLKIDRTFLSCVPESMGDCRLLRAMIVMARSLGLRVIAEGVETRAQAELCRDYGADVLQGFYFFRPLPSSEFIATYKSSAHSPESQPSIAMGQ